MSKINNLQRKALQILRPALAIMVLLMSSSMLVYGTDNYIDAVDAAADNYKLLSEDGKIRVIEMNLKAGMKDNKHSHYNETVYFISGGKARITVDGKAMELEIPDGYVLHHGPWTHQVENIGDKDIQAIIFEQMP